MKAVRWQRLFTCTCAAILLCAATNVTLLHAQDMTGRMWGEGEYLNWWMKGTGVPALVTTSPNNVAEDDAGVLGLQTTSVLLGDERLDENSRPGGRLTLGLWLGDEQLTGLSATVFTLGDGSNTDFSADTDEFAVLARPFFNVRAGNVGEDSELVSFPNILDGRIDVHTSSELHSFSTLLHRTLRRYDQDHVDALIGYRYLRFREGLAVAEDLEVTDPGGVIQQGTRIQVLDQFSVENDFHGVEMGVLMERSFNVWSIKALAKAAFGDVRLRQRIVGETVITTPGDPSVASEGGLLALSSNIGTEEKNRFAVVPELGVNVRYALTDGLSLTTGYSVLWLTNAWRVGDRIDRNVDSSQIPGPRHEGDTNANPPFRSYDDTSFWVQGVSFGVVLTR